MQNCFVTVQVAAVVIMCCSLFGVPCTWVEGKDCLGGSFKRLGQTRSMLHIAPEIFSLQHVLVTWAMTTTAELKLLDSHLSCQAALSLMQLSCNACSPSQLAHGEVV